MRSLLLLSLVAGCSPDATHGYHGDPDACMHVVGAYQLAAPKQDQTYPASMDVYVNESERWAVYNVSMLDEAGHDYQWTTDSTMKNPDPAWWSLDNFHYELAPGHRYTVTISTCDDQQSATFFTRP